MHFFFDTSLIFTPLFSFNIIEKRKKGAIPPVSQSHYQKIEYSFHNLFLLLILIVQHILFSSRRGNFPLFLIASLSLKRKNRGKN